MSMNTNLKRKYCTNEELDSISTCSSKRSKVSNDLNEENIPDNKHDKTAMIESLEVIAPTMFCEKTQKIPRRKQLNLRARATANKARNIEQNTQDSKNSDVLEDTEKQQSLLVDKNSFKHNDQGKICDANVGKIDSASNELELQKSNVKSCPVCKCDFDNLACDAEINEHINKCLDSKTSDSSPSEVCQLCSKDISKYTTVRRQQHLNRCCDNLEKMTCPRTDVTSILCPICGKHFKTTRSRQTHMKKCAKENNVSTHQLVELNRQENGTNPTNTKVSSSSTSGQSNTKARQNTLRIFRDNRRKRKVSLPSKDLDEDTQVALALSASMQSDNANLSDIDGKGRKKKKANSELPALLLRSENEMKKIMEARAAAILCHWADDDDEIQCTPALAPSSLVKKYGKESSSEIDPAKHEPEQSTESNLEGTTGRCYSPTIEVRSGSNSKKEQSCDCSKESASQSTVYSCGDENKRYLTIDTQTRLWNLASLRADVVTTNDFYVPNLLPKSTPRKKKVATPSKKNTARSANSITDEQQLHHFAPVENDDKDVREGPPSKIASHDEGLTESQERDIEMLVELISDENSDLLSNIGEEEQNEEIDKTWFPSSGFCVRKDTYEMQDKTNEHVATLLNDLSCMVGNPLLSDVEIVAKDNKKFFAHSFMLSARCNALAEMLQTSDICQKDDDRNTLVRIELTDIDVRAVRAVLTYIYTAYFIPVIENVIEDVKKLVHRWNMTCDADKWDVIQDRMGQDDKDIIEHQDDRAENLDVLLKSLWEGEEEIVTKKEDENMFGDSIFDDELGNMEITIYTQVSPKKITRERNDTSAELFVLDSDSEDGKLSVNGKTLTNVETASNDGKPCTLEKNVLKNENDAASLDNMFIPETPSKPCSSPGKDCAEENVIKDDSPLFHNSQLVDFDHLNNSLISLISPASPVELLSSPERSPLAENIDDYDMGMEASDSEANVNQRDISCNESNTTQKDVNETTKTQSCTLTHHSNDQDIIKYEDEPELLKTEANVNQESPRCFDGNTTNKDVSVVLDDSSLPLNNTLNTEDEIKEQKNCDYDQLIDCYDEGGFNFDDSTRTQSCTFNSHIVLDDSSLPSNNTLNTEVARNKQKNPDDDQFIDCYDDGGFNCDINDYFNYDSFNTTEQDNNAGPDNEKPGTSYLIVRDTVESNVRDEETRTTNNNQKIDNIVQRKVQKGKNNFQTKVNEKEKISEDSKKGENIKGGGGAKKHEKVSDKQTKVNNNPPHEFKLREPRTPMLDYSNMATPDLKGELEQYGVRPLPKRKMVFKLKEIYNYTHREIHSENKTDVEKEDNKSSSNKQQLSNDEQVEPLYEDKNNKQENRQDTESDTDREENLSGEELSDDADMLSQESSLNLTQKLMSVLTQDRELYFKILTHNISLSEMLETIKASGIKCSVVKLKDFLDEQCITYSDPRPARPPRKRRYGKMKTSKD